MANESSNTGSGNQDQGQNSPQQGLYENQDLYLGAQAQSEGLYGKNMNKVKNPNVSEDNVYAETTDGLGYSEQSSEVQAAEEREKAREMTPFQQQATAGVYGAAPGQTGHEHTPYQDMHPVTQPAQQQQADTAQAQNWEREQQVGQVPGQQSGPTTGKDFEHASGMTGYYGGTTQEEQEGQKANVEQAHDSNTAQYTGKPGTKAPSPGQQSGTAWGQDMELSNDNTPARDPDSY